MKLQPSDVARELRQFSFFQSFSDDLLMQICTMTEVASFKKGDLLLKEGQTNKCLYFLRSGVVEVVLAGEVVTILQNPGEVIGDMSVATGRPVSTNIRAAADVDCFVINSEHFSRVSPNERDHFMALLYRIYSIVLADRLIKTNEKARLFEIANRELHQAQVNLEKIGSRRVLLVVTDRKQLVMAKMAVGATGVLMDAAADTASGLQLYAKNDYDLILCDESCGEILNKAKAEEKRARLVLITDKEIRQNLPILQNMMAIDNLITRDPDDRAFTIRMILTTLTKLLTDEPFGLDKYMTWGVDVQTRSVESSAHRDDLKDEMCEYFKKMGIRSTILERCSAVTEEMLMNAIYDAPMDSYGRSLFNHLSRQTKVILDSHLRSEIRFACDGTILGVSVVDPFGGLTKKIVVDYLESCYTGNAGSLNHGKGGAGRGLHQIVENSDLTIFNVKRGFKTEVICLFHVEGHKRESRPSFHYFFSE